MHPTSQPLQLELKYKSMEWCLSESAGSLKLQLWKGPVWKRPVILNMELSLGSNSGNVHIRNVAISLWSILAAPMLIPNFLRFSKYQMSQHRIRQHADGNTTKGHWNTNRTEMQRDRLCKSLPLSEQYLVTEVPPAFSRPTHRAVILNQGNTEPCGALRSFYRC